MRSNGLIVPSALTGLVARHAAGGGVLERPCAVAPAARLTLQVKIASQSLGFRV